MAQTDSEVVSCVSRIDRGNLCIIKETKRCRPLGSTTEVGLAIRYIFRLNVMACFVFKEKSERT